MTKLFNRVGRAMPGRSVFNLSYEKKFSCDMGSLIPVLCEEAVPGDIWDIGGSAVIRFQPLVAPVLHQVDMYVHSFFVPYRLLWDEWEDFITGGPMGDLVPTLPRWDPKLCALGAAKGSLWDYMGFPLSATPLTFNPVPFPLDFPRRAYYMVYNEYYRDETLQDEVPFDASPDPQVDLIMPRNWRKDYFSSALPFQQRGTSPALPLTGTTVTSAVWPSADFGFIPQGGGGVSHTAPVGVDFSTLRTLLGPNIDSYSASEQANILANLRSFFADNTVTVDFSGVGTFDISDLRLAFQIQRWLERNARAGVRYTEFLGAHFGVAPTDDRLDRPEYIGGMKAPVIFSEVLQTSETGSTPQGNLAGHGLSVSGEKIGTYRVQEFGIIISMFSVMPKPCYQQGINRQWLRETRYDFYFPEFAHLSEQQIFNHEIFSESFVGGVNPNLLPFGYCGAYDEMRVKHDMVCGDFRDTYDYWHLGREFLVTPELGNGFLECVPRKDIFAVPSEPGLLVQWGNILKVLRPMPIIAEPGLIDHG